MYNLKRGPKGTIFFISESGLNFSFQEAALLLSMIAARLKRESEKMDEGNLTETDVAEVQNLVLEHIITN